MSHACDRLTLNRLTQTINRTTGMEGRLVLSDAEVDALKAAPDNKHRAAKWIIEQVNKYPGEVVLLCLGMQGQDSSALASFLRWRLTQYRWPHKHRLRMYPR